MLDLHSTIQVVSELHATVLGNLVHRASFSADNHSVT